jgi:hypothetical protein
MTEIVEKILNRYSLKLLSVAFIVLGLFVLADFYILEHELFKTIILFFFIVGSLHWLGIFISLLKQKMDDFIEERNRSMVALETFKSLTKEETRYVYDYIKHNKRRFNSLDIADLLQSNIFIEKAELTDYVVVELDPVVRKYINQKLKGKS